MVEPEREREFPATRVVPVKTGVVPFFTRLGLEKNGSTPVFHETGLGNKRDQKREAGSLSRSVQALADGSNKGRRTS